MNKLNNELRYGLVLILAGIVFILTFFIVNGKIRFLIFGFACTSFVGGIPMLIRYFYYKKHIKNYLNKVENDNITIIDERNVLYRNEAGRYVYISSMVIIVLSIFFFSLLFFFEIYDSLIIMVYLFILLIVLYVIGQVKYSRLKKQK